MQGVHLCLEMQGEGDWVKAGEDQFTAPIPLLGDVLFLRPYMKLSC
jgi:hypothetical protein